MPTASFAADLALSHAHEIDWQATYKRVWPDLIATYAVPAGVHEWQQAGVDRILLLPNGRQLWIDEKIRRQWHGDLLLEYTSNTNTGKPGWAVSPEQRCDYVATAILPLKRCYLIPAELLRRTTIANLTEWREKYRTVTARNPGYQTLSVAVPFPQIFLALCKQMCSEWGPADGSPDPQQ